MVEDVAGSAIGRFGRRRLAIAQEGGCAVGAIWTISKVCQVARYNGSDSELCGKWLMLYALVVCSGCQDGRKSLKRVGVVISPNAASEETTRIRIFSKFFHTILHATRPVEQFLFKSDLGTCSRARGPDVTESHVHFEWGVLEQLSPRGS